ncbi:MAG: MFS transporter, partial [Muribaculum intestinale]|nr:MFS transporter [Muribaculum intestinale]
MNPTSLQEESRTAFRVLFAISIAHLLNDMVQSIVPSIYPIIKEEMGLSFIQIGVITLVFQLTSSLLQPFVGMYADRRPSPYALAAGMCFTLTGLIWLAFTGSYAAMLGAVSVIGIGSSIFHPEASRVAQLAAGGKKGLAQSIFQVGGNGGPAIGPLLAARIV